MISFMLKVGIHQPGLTTEKKSSILLFMQEPSMMQGCPSRKGSRVKSNLFFQIENSHVLSGSKLPSLAKLIFLWGACHTGQELKPKTLTTLVKTQSQFMVKITTLHIKNATSNAKPKMGFVSGSPSF
jgi:hypothetical protein